MFAKEIKSEFELRSIFPDEEACIKFLEKQRWGSRVVSPFDPESKVYTFKNGKYQCKNTKKYFNVKTGTMFDSTKLPLTMWFTVIWKLLSNKHGVSSHQIARDMGITQKTAWFLSHKIRNAMDIQDNEPMENKVEADEALFGGLNGNRHKSKKRVRNGKGVYTDKVYVVGMIQREGNLKCFIVPDREKQTLQPLLKRNIVKGATVITDGHKGYEKLDARFNHHTVKDGKRAKTDFHDRDIHTNNIESAWTVMKEGYIGIYNWWSPQHFQKYLGEFVFRRNTRKMREGERFNFYFQNFTPKTTQKDIVYGNAA